MIKRAWLSISRKRSKTIILGVLMFIIANLVLATIFIKNATEESMNYAKSSLGSEVYLQADMEKLMSQMEQNRQEENFDSSNRQMFKLDRPEISIETVETIANSDYVKDYSFSIGTSANAVSFDIIESETTGDNNRPGRENLVSNMGDIQIEGISSYAYITGVQNKTLSLTEGTYFDETSNDKVIISYELSEQNELSIGDKITLENYSTEKEVILEIIGIYTSSESDDGRSFINSSNQIYMNVQTAVKFLSEEDYNEGSYSVNNVTYYLNNPETSDSFIEEANLKVPSLEEDNLILDINNSAYESMVGPIESVGSFATTLLVIVVLASIAIISLLINNQIKDRKYEIGVLMSLGETKKNIVLQVLVELLMVAVFAFLLSAATSIFIADKMAGSLLENQITMNEEEVTNNFGRPGFNMNNTGGNRENSSRLNNVEVINEINVVSNFTDYIISFGLGFIIIFTSMMLPTYNIMKYEPKTILTRRD